MTVSEVLQAIQAATLAAQRAKELFDTVKDTLSSNDQAKIRVALVKMQADNDRMYEEVMEKLRQGQSR